MSESLRELAVVEYGASPKEIRVENETAIKIFGTGGLVGYSRTPLFEQPLVVVARKGTLDKPIYSEKPCWVIDTAFAVIPKKDIDAKWLYYQLSNYDLKKLNEATGVPSISRDLLYRVKFEKPSFPTQRKIARILSTADAVIEKIQAAIAKYKAIKQGMLHDLFTRGIDPATNKLRPTYEDAPHLYKKSKLGWIPKEWEVDTIENISKRIWIGLVTTMTTHYVENGIPLIRNNNIRNNMIEKEDMIKLDVVFSESNSQRYLHKGDIVTVHTGDIGTSAMIDETLDPSHGFATINTTVDSVKIINLYLCFYFNWNEFKTRIEVYATGDGRSNLNLYDFLYIPTAFPKDIFEQNLIIERLNSINQKLQTEQTYLHKLQQIKAGLMADLLSRKKKVDVDEDPGN